MIGKEVALEFLYIWLLPAPPPPNHAFSITLHIFHFLNWKVTVPLKSPIGDK